MFEFVYMLFRNNYLNRVNILEASCINVVIPQKASPTIIEITNTKTIIALVLLFNLTFFIKKRIIGSINNDSMNAIKKGI